LFSEQAVLICINIITCDFRKADDVCFPKKRPKTQRLNCYSSSLVFEEFKAI